MSRFLCWLLGHEFIRHNNYMQLEYDDNGKITHCQCYRCDAMFKLVRWVKEGGK